jgi:hypothetical protein
MNPLKSSPFSDRDEKDTETFRPSPENTVGPGNRSVSSTSLGVPEAPATYTRHTASAPS